MKINNEIYSRPDYSWWGDDSTNNLLKCFINPVRFCYFRRVLRDLPQSGGLGKILDVGCGGGLLSEEFAKLGYKVTGIDPSKRSLEEAAEHAAKNNLDIEYREGYGENLPFKPKSFDCVVCCDVLEHVNDRNKVISEISRVLRPGGFFFYDTINRTLLSGIIVILLMQEWKFTAFEERGTHVWNMFVKPSELYANMKCHGLVPQEIKGISSGSGPFVNFLNLRKRVKGEISRSEMGARLKIRESKNISVSYMGYAIKE